MNKKKIRLHLFSSETGHRSEEFGWFRGVVWSFVVLISIVGLVWILNDPDMITRFRGEPEVKSLISENESLKKTLEGVESQEQVLQNSLHELKESVERVSNLAGVVPDSTPKLELIESGDFLDEVNAVLVDAKFSLNALEENLDKIKSLPVLHPVKERRFMSAGYEARLDPFTGSWIPHRAVDFPGNVGDTVVATAHGKVIVARNSKIEGLKIKIDHSHGLSTKYTHLEELLVKNGQKVKRGQAIALLGNSGRSTGSHLHYEIIYKDRLLNPKAFMLPDAL